MPSALVTLISGSGIPVGSVYGPVFSSFRFADPQLHDRKKTSNSQFVEVLSIKGRIQSRDGNGEWLSFLQPARDMIEQNLLLVRSRDDGEMYIRASQHIPRGETLTCWYEDSLAIEMNIPYLTPLHIRGIHEYICNWCESAFHFPNLLKMHIMYNCYPSKTSSTFPITHACASTSGTQESKPNDHSKPPGFEIGSAKPLYTNSDLSYRRVNSVSEMEGMAIQTASSFLPLTLKASFEIIPNYSYIPSQQYPTVHGDEKTAHLGKFERQVNRTQYDINMPSIKRSMSHNGKFYQDDKPSRQAEDTFGAMTFTDLESCDEEPIEVLKKCSVDLSTKDGHLCVYCGSCIPENTA